MPRQRYQKKSLSPTQRKEVKKLVMAPMEKKNFPWFYQDLDITDVHNISNITAIPQGDGEAERDGDSVKITGTYGRGAIIVGDGFNMVRLTLIRWKCNGEPTAAQIYDLTNIGTNGSMYSPFNHNYRDQFVVLQDKFINLDTYNPYKQVIIKAGPQPKTTYNAGAITGINKIYMILSSDSTVGPHPKITF